MKALSLQGIGPRLARVAMALLLLPCAALAGGKAVLITNGDSVQVAGQRAGDGANTSTLAWRDAGTLRMDMGAQAGYLLMRDDKVYSVTQSGSETQVMELSVMMKMMQSMGRPGAKNNSKNPFGRVDSVAAIGATETVAGIKGRVYNMTWTNRDGDRQSDVAVLTNNPLVVEMTRAYVGIMDSMAGKGMTRAFHKALPGKDQGLLRVGDQFRVQSIRRIDLPASTFVLPAKPMDMQSLMGGMGGR